MKSTPGVRRPSKVWRWTRPCPQRRRHSPHQRPTSTMTSSISPTLIYLCVPGLPRSADHNYFVIRLLLGTCTMSFVLSWPRLLSLPWSAVYAYLVSSRQLISLVDYAYLVLRSNLTTPSGPSSSAGHAYPILHPLQRRGRPDVTAHHPTVCRLKELRNPHCATTSSLFASTLVV